MVGNFTGAIDLSTCVDVVARTFNDNMIPLAVMAGIFAFGAVIAVLLYVYSKQENDLKDSFLRREKLLNKYEEWKRDRRL